MKIREGREGAERKGTTAHCIFVYIHHEIIVDWLLLLNAGYTGPHALLDMMTINERRGLC